VDDSTKLVRVTMSEASVNHPTDAELHALSVGQLRDVELARISAHLDSCPECCHRIDELGSDDPLLGRLKQSAARAKEVLVPLDMRRSAVHALREGLGAPAEREQLRG
jgi:anti-sigma factor RsiW